MPVICTAIISYKPCNTLREEMGAITIITDFRNKETEVAQVAPGPAPTSTSFFLRRARLGHKLLSPTVAAFFFINSISFFK